MLPATQAKTCSVAPSKETMNSPSSQAPDQCSSQPTVLVLSAYFKQNSFSAHFTKPRNEKEDLTKTAWEIII